MATHTIVLPEPLSRYVSERVEYGSFETTDLYLAELIRRDQAKWNAAMAELDAIVEDAEASGISERSFREIIDVAREEYDKQGLSAAERAAGGSANEPMAISARYTSTV